MTNRPHYTATERGPRTGWQTVRRYKVTDDTGRHLGYVTASQTSQTYLTWPAYSPYSHPISTGHASRAAAGAATLRSAT